MPLVSGSMYDLLSWTATVATIGGAVLTASNRGARVTGTGFIVFLVGSICWLGVGLLGGQPALVWTNVVLTVLNLFGIWRWLGRQAAIDHGGKAAAQASEATPGEALFPVSRLLRAKVTVAGKDVAACVDAMAGARSGLISYVVISEGGVAGVGERMRRLDWKNASLDCDRLVVLFGADGYDALPELTKDEWPGR